MIREAPKAPPVYGQDGTSRFDPLPSASGAEKATIAVVTPTLSPNREGDMPLTPDGIGQDISLGLIKVGLAALLGRIFGPQRLWWVASVLGAAALLAIHFAWPTEILTLRDTACIMGGALVAYGGIVGLHWRGVQIPLLPTKTTAVQVVTHAPLPVWTRAFFRDAEWNRGNNTVTAIVELITSNATTSVLTSARSNPATGQDGVVRLHLTAGGGINCFLDLISAETQIEVRPGANGRTCTFRWKSNEALQRLTLMAHVRVLSDATLALLVLPEELRCTGTLRIEGDVP